MASINAIKVIKDKSEYDAAEAKYKSIIVAEKKLKIQWDEIETVIEYKRLFAQKQALEGDFGSAKKYIKSGPMKAYDDAQEAKDRAEEQRLAAILQAKADAETARQVAEQKRLFDIAEVARKAAEVIAKKAEAAAALAAKKGNEEAAAIARQKAEDARQAAKLEADRQAAARAEADAIRADAAAAPAPVVVVEKSHTGVTRRKVYRWRLTCKDGRKFTKAEMTTSTRLTIAELAGLPPHLYVLSPVLLNEFVDSQGEAAAIPGVLEVASSMV